MAVTMLCSSTLALAFFALVLTAESTGSSSPAKMAMMAMTTSSSISVKADLARLLSFAKDFTIGIVLHYCQFFNFSIHQ